MLGNAEFTLHDFESHRIVVRNAVVKTIWGSIQLCAHCMMDRKQVTHCITLQLEELPTTQQTIAKRTRDVKEITQITLIL